MSYTTFYITFYITSLITSYTTSCITFYIMSYITSYTTSYITSYTTSYITSYAIQRSIKNYFSHAGISSQMLLKTTVWNLFCMFLITFWFLVILNFIKLDLSLFFHSLFPQISVNFFNELI